MKTFISISAILISAGASLNCASQITIDTPKVLDTIYANDTKNVALFFPEPIRQGITGSENFIFTYNRGKEQNFGLLQAKPGNESNLLVINRNGLIFSYIVNYKETLSKLNYFIATSSSIGNVKPKVKDSINAENSRKSDDYRKYYYEKFSNYLLNENQCIGIANRRNGITLSVENIVFDREELYFIIKIENGSTLDYDLNFLNLSIETRQKGKRKSLQRLYQEPIFKYHLPSKIGEKETTRFVYVLSKFSLSKDRRVILELNEKDGERNIELRISHSYINHPK